MQVQTKRRKRKESISKSAFRVKYLRRSRKLWNRYLNSRPWVNQLYESFLDIRPGQKIVDVGCGPGDFTRYLARLSDGKSKILGVDSNPKSIKAGIADTKKAHLSHVVSYKLGEKLPGIFQEAGLVDMKAEIQNNVYLGSDPRQPLNDVKEELRFYLAFFKERMDKDRKYQVAGGLSNAKVSEYNKGYVSKTEALLADNQKLRQDPTIITDALYIVSGSMPRQT